MGACFYIANADPSEMVVKTKYTGETKYIRGSTTCVVPCIHPQVLKFDLNVMTLEIDSKDVLTSQFVPVCVEAVARVRIDADERALETGLFMRTFGELGHRTLAEAAEELAGMDGAATERITNAIKSTCLTILEGAQRSLISQMTAEELNYDKKKVAALAKPIFEENMEPLGMTMDSYVISRVYDDHGYFAQNSGLMTARTAAEAEINTDRNNADSEIKTLQAKTQEELTRMQATMQSEKVRFVEDTKKNIEDQKRAIAQIQQNRETEMKRLTSDFEAAKQRLQLDRDTVVANVIADAEQVIATSRKEVETLAAQKIETQALWKTHLADVVRKVELARQAVPLKQQALEKDIIQKARFEAKQNVTQAKADADAKIKMAEADAKKVVLEATSKADKIRMEGEASAKVTIQKGQAHAEAMEKKAESWNEFGQTALRQRLAEKLPQCAAEVAASLQHAEIIRIDGSSGDVALLLAGCMVEIETVAALTDLEPQDVKNALLERLGGDHQLAATLRQVGPV